MHKHSGRILGGTIAAGLVWFSGIPLAYGASTGTTCDDPVSTLRIYADPDLEMFGSGLTYRANTPNLRQSLDYDTQDQSIIAGTFAGSIDLGSGAVAPLQPPEEGFVAKYSVLGTLLWSHLIPRGSSIGRLNINAVATGPNDEVVITGNVAGSVDFGAGLQTSQASVSSIFVAKYDATGVLQWSSLYGDSITRSAGGQDIVVDANGRVYVAGYFEQRISFDPANTFVATDIEEHGYLLQLDPSGSVNWARAFLGDPSSAEALTVDPSDNVIVAGGFSGTEVFGSTLLASSAGSRDIFVAKYDSGATSLWAKQFGGTGGETATGLAALSNGDVAVSGEFEGLASFDATNLSSAGDFDGFVGRLQAGSGAVLWASPLGTASDDQFTSVDVGPADSIFVGATMGSPLTAAGFALGGASIVRYGPTGTLDWGTQVPNGFVVDVAAAEDCQVGFTGFSPNVPSVIGPDTYPTATAFYWFLQP
ncbi:MAG: hypothetical protein AAGA48_37730 [Myxococcota bacterium]